MLVVWPGSREKWFSSLSLVSRSFVRVFAGNSVLQGVLSAFPMASGSSAPGGRPAEAGGSGGPSSTSQMRQQVLLERLRAKSAHFRSFPELSKAVRTAVLDRRFSLDSEEKAVLQRALDTLQEKIPVRSAHGMAERLETIGRKIGLKFMAAPVHGCFYLSTEMFYVEINIDGGSGGSGSSAGSAKVNEAKIHHIDATQQNQQNTVVSSHLSLSLSLQVLLILVSMFLV